MCGIAGLVDPSLSPGEIARLAERMAQSILHRGPDEGQTWVEPDAGVALAFRRLAIVDLSTAGRQPMTSDSRRYVIVYNGEIYNAEEMRRALGADVPCWRGHSDTEVLLEWIARRGIASALEKANGMFALALWDRSERRLTLARDRMGKKPLYWWRDGRRIVFGSELRALGCHPALPRGIDRSALAGYLRHGYMLHPYTIYAGVGQLPPGHVVTIGPGGGGEPQPFWSLAEVARRGRRELFAGDDAAALEELGNRLGSAVRRRLVSDVPLGAFLSGGIDSSTIVALMQQGAAAPVRTFAIGFEEDAFNEAPHAAAVARHLGTDHTELVVTAKAALDVIPRLADIYDEPFADSSAIPTCIVSALARQHVTVALSGDGGDELFAGYDRYRDAERLMRTAGRLPLPLRRLGSSAVSRLSTASLDLMIRPLPERVRRRLSGDRLKKLGAIAGHSGDELYRALISIWPDPAAVLNPDLGPVAEPASALTDTALPDLIAEPISRLAYRDARSYLPDDILTKVDRASMAVSLEARAPLLDPEVVAFAYALPERFKVRDGEAKWLLRRLAYKLVPRPLLDRPKSGFAVPIGTWLRGPLKDWADDLVSERSLRDSGLLDPAVVRTTWSEHLAGARNWSFQIWTVLMLLAWQRRHGGTHAG
ncbi:MAG TPA: asparagine synthase (glutamine-hydrolyzing) [Hyphomicrobiaceae bacterium]|nr:asparagine synthase (glutamine-hydrolyzing) [Hyphomicrobiaceae bacterium]